LVGGVKGEAMKEESESNRRWREKYKKTLEAKVYDDVFPDLCKIYPPHTKVGTAVVKHFEITRSGALRYMLANLEGIETGKFVGLYIDKLGVVMSDTRMERYSCIGFVRQAKGNVLVAGLGLGMVLFPLRGADGVKKITVLEKNGDVIKIVSPYVAHQKIEIVQADVYDWTPPQGASYDTIWFDIWHGRCTDNLKQMTVLHRRYRKYLAQGGYMDSWYRDELRRIRRREQREDRVRTLFV